MDTSRHFRVGTYLKNDILIALATIYNTSMKRTTMIDKTEKVGITLPIRLVKQTDKARRDIPRSTFIRRAVEQYIRRKGGK